jgi:hypothetical protein
MNPTVICIGPTFAGRFDGLAQVMRSLGSVPGVKSRDQEVHTHAVSIRSPGRKWSMVLDVYWRTSVAAQTEEFVSSATLLRRNSNSFIFSEILYIVHYWNGRTTVSVELNKESRKSKWLHSCSLKICGRMAHRHVRTLSLKCTECFSQTSLQKGFPPQFHKLN